MSFVAVDTQSWQTLGVTSPRQRKEAVYYVGWVVTNGGVIETSFEISIGGK